MPTPNYGDADTGTGVAPQSERLSAADPNDPFSGYVAETDPNYAGYRDSKRPDGSPAWVYKNGQWYNTTTGRGTLDERKPGGEATMGYWIDGLFSGRRDIMGRDTPAEAARKKQEADAAAAQERQDQISAQMQKFIDSMLGPMDQNDPIYKGLLQAGIDAAQKQGGRAGLAGRSGLGATNAAAVVQQNVLPWMQARQQAGQQMLEQLSNRDISLSNISLAQQQVNQGLAESQYNATKNTMTTLGSVGGGILGGIYGGPGGATAGAQLGGAVLGTIGSGQAPAAAPTYRPGSGYKPSGPSGSGY